MSGTAASGVGRPLRLFFVRHGETDWNAEGRLQGQQDIPLNERGRGQAAEAGRRLATLGIDPGALPWQVSPLQRTRDTATLARQALGLVPDAVTLEPALVELSFGRWEGLTWRELRNGQPEVARAREANKWDYQPPGGESYAMLADRLRPWASTVSGDLIVVAHGGVARALLHILCGVPPIQAPSIDIWQGRVLLIDNGRYSWV